MKKKEKISVIAGLYGNALEWYDFLLYASFAPLFAEIFFPTKLSSFASLMATYSVFAVSFLMRPIGGAVLGHIADHIGRRKALILSVSVMTLSTACIGFLPAFHSVGIIAPILFTLLRMIQGLAVGGELPGSATFLIEHMFAHRRGFAGSLVLSTAFLGIFVGSLTASLLSASSSPDFLSTWGWRLAYLFGAVLGLFGIYLRTKSFESPAFSHAKPTAELPAKLVFVRYPKYLLLAITFTSIMALANYVLIAYVSTFLVKSEGMSLHNALVINFIAIFVLTLLIPLLGLLSDVVGRRPVFLYGLGSLLLATFPIFWLLMSGHWYPILFGEILLAIVLAPINATVPTIIAEMFPTAVRASGTSIGYNIGQAVFGGTVPLVALTLIKLTGNKIAPAWYILGASLVVFIVAVFFLKESFQKKL